MTDVEQENILIDRGYDPDNLPENVNEIFLRACRDADIVLVKAFLELNSSLVFINTKESNPLTRTVESGNIEMVKFLVSLGVNIDLKDKDGDTPFQTSLNWKFYEIASYLLDQGATPTNINKKKISALSVTVRNNLDDLFYKMLDLDVKIDDYAASWTVLENKPLYLKAFLNKGLSPNSCISFSETPFIQRAVLKKFPEIVKALLEGGADVNAENEFGWTAWMMAAYFKYDEICQILESFGAKTNEMSMMEPIELAKSGDLDKLTKLLESGVDANSRQYQGLNLLFWAVSKKNYHLIDVLLKHGADPNCVYNEKSATMTYLTVGEDRRIDLVEKLLAAGAKPNEGEHGSLALFNAILNEDLRLVELLIEAGANVNTKNEYNENGLVKAIVKDNPELFKLLKIKGCDINGSDGYPPIHAAIYKQKIDLLHWLIKEGANLDLKDKFGLTPLMKAAQTETGESEEIARLLLANGANYLVEDRVGLNALQNTKLYGHKVYGTIKEFIQVKALDFESIVPDMTEWTFFSWLETENYWAIKRIVEAGYDLNKRHHLPPLIYCSRKFKRKAFKQLVELGADVQNNGVDTEGVLSAAVKLGIEEVKLCLDHGADLDYITGSGRTAFTKACQNEADDIIELLLEKGAAINPCKAGFSPLMEATRSGRNKGLS